MKWRENDPPHNRKEVKELALFTNQASLSYNGKTVLSNLTTGELIDVLSATKTAGANDYLPGTTIPYVVVLKNSGTTTVTDLVVTDDLGAYAWGTGTLQPLTYVEGSVRYFIDGVLQSTPAVQVSPSLVISGISVPAEGTATILYNTTANEFAPPETAGEITNTVTVTGATPETVTASATVPAASQADLTIQKSISPAVARQGETIGYTFVIENHGSAAATGVTVEDLFDPILQGFTVALNGTPWTPGVQYTYNETTGLFQSLSGSITVPPATFEQDPDTGVWTNVPGSVTLTVSGTL